MNLTFEAIYSHFDASVPKKLQVCIENVACFSEYPVVYVILDSRGSRCGLVVGSCEYDNEPSGSIRGSEFLD
jgi:hypothetical protein